MPAMAAERHLPLAQVHVVELHGSCFGALRDFLNLLGDEDDIARFEYLKKSARNFGSVLIGIETKHAENFPVLKQRFDAAGLRYQDITENEVLANLII